MENTIISNTFCPMPWIHLYVHTTGDVAPCCISSDFSLSNINSSGLESAWNSDKMKEIRVDMLNGKQHKNCETCYRQERLGVKSQRLHNLTEQGKSMNNMHEKLAQTLPDGTFNEFHLEHMDFRFSNLCNFKCRTCNPEFSTSIATENYQNNIIIGNIESKIHMLSGPTKNHAYEEFKKHYPYIVDIYFAGGEPLIQWEHWQILKDLTESGRSSAISLCYSTNGSNFNYKGMDPFYYWNQFDEISLCFSVDAAGTRAEYWRHGSQWSEILGNINKVTSWNKTHREKRNPIYVYIASTISWPNVYAWIDLIKGLIETGTITTADHMGVNILNGPLEYSLQSIPLFKKEQIRDALLEFKVYLSEVFKSGEADQHIDGIVTFMMARDTSNSLDFTDLFRIDQIRQEDFFSVFPEHEDMREILTGSKE